MTDALRRGPQTSVAMTVSDEATIQNWADALANTENYRLDDFDRY
jgi:hypothetical protein